MREMIAVWIAVMTGILVCVLAVQFALIQNQATRSPGIMTPVDVEKKTANLPVSITHTRETLDLELGRALYDLLRCRACHSIKGEGNRRNPLDGAGKQLNEEEIRQWILAPGEIDPGTGKPDYTYLSQEQVKLLVKYVKSLK